MTKSKNFSKKFSLLMIFMLLMSIITTQAYADNFNFNEKNYSNFDKMRLTDGLKDINPGNGIKEPREGSKTGRLTFEVVKKGETYYRCIIKDARGNKIISREVTVKGWIMPLFDYQLWR